MLASSILVTLLLSAQLDSPVTTRAQELATQALQTGNTVRGAAALIRLHALIDDVDDLNLLAEPYANLLYRGGTEPRVRTLARLFYADVERARGRTTKAAEMLGPLGFIQDFYAVGSFDNEGKAGCDIDFGPEKALDLGAKYPAKTREVSWQKLPARTLDGYVDLSTLLKPNTEAVAYALTFLKVDKETRVNLSLGTSGAHRLFVNGIKVSTDNRYHLPRIDQSRVQVTLRKGLNRVLLKVCQENGPLGFYLRWEKAERPFADVTAVLPDKVPPLEKGGAPRPTPVPTLADAYAQLLKAMPNDAAARADYATVLAWFRAYDDKEHTVAHEAERAAEASTHHPARADILFTAGVLADDHNQRRRFITQGLAEPAPKEGSRSSTRDFLTLELARLELEAEHPHLTLQLTNELLKRYPLFAPARVLKARALDALGDRTASLNEMESAFAALPHSPALAREAITLSRRMDRWDEAVGRARMMIALRYDDTNTRRGLANLLADMEQLDGALEQLRRVLALDPYDNGSRLRYAELSMANGRFDAGKAAFAEARTFAPDDSEVYEREGRALLLVNHKEEALAAFTRSLSLRPQNAALKEMLRALQGDADAQAPVPTVAIAPLLPEAAAYKNEDAVILTDLQDIRVQPTGLSSRFTQLAVKVLTARGVEAFRQMPISYSPDRQEVRVLKARITKPDGSIVDSFQDSDRNINEPWTGMYYDVRMRALSFPALAPGDVLELQWKVDDTATDNLLSDYWGDVESVQGVYPKVRYQYTVHMPAGRELYWNQEQQPAWLKMALDKAKDGKLEYRFNAEKVPKLVPEPMMPGLAEITTVLHISTYKTWNDVGRYYWGLVRDQLVPNEELKRTVDKVLNGIPRKDERKVVQALYGFVVTNTRYVALEFGIHGYKPYRVDKVLARKFGDCKDKASLLVAMLKLAGIDAQLVLLRMRHLGQLASTPASLAAFNHAIAYVPKLNLYLDGTAEFHGSLELPSADRLANVLVIDPNGARALVTPEAAPDDNLTQVNMDVTLKADGSAELKGDSTVAGQSAPDNRRAYQAVATRKTTFEQSWASSFPGLSVAELDVSDVTRLEEPLRTRFRMQVPRYAEVGPGLLRFYPFGAGRSFSQVLAALPERKHDLVFPGVWKNVFKFRYALPDGYAAEDLPEAKTLDSPFGSVQISTAVVDGALRCEVTMALTTPRVKVGEYAAFRSWLLGVDEVFSRKLTARKAGGQTASRAP